MATETMNAQKITVKKIISQRYPAGVSRPLNWDQRIEGIDTVESIDGATYSLQSSGQQSVPQPGWVILVDTSTSGTHKTWTLFGLPKGTAVAA